MWNYISATIYELKKLEMSIKTSVPYEHDVAEHPACIQTFVLVAAHTHTHTLCKTHQD